MSNSERVIPNVILLREVICASFFTESGDNPKKQRFDLTHCTIENYMTVNNSMFLFRDALIQNLFQTKFCFL